MTRKTWYRIALFLPVFVPVLFAATFWIPGLTLNDEPEPTGLDIMVRSHPQQFFYEVVPHILILGYFYVLLAHILTWLLQKAGLVKD